MENIFLSPITKEDLKSFISEAVKAEVQKLNTSQKVSEDLDLISRKEAAKILGISLPTLNQWSKEGIILSYRIKSRVRYKKHEIEKALTKVKTATRLPH